MPAMEPVDSSMIEAVGYDPERRELHVRFKGGRSCVHHDVPADDHEALMTAGSVGQHYHSAVRSAYRSTKG